LSVFIRAHQKGIFVKKLQTLITSSAKPTKWLEIAIVPPGGNYEAMVKRSEV